MPKPPISQDQFYKGLPFETQRLAKWCSNTGSPLDSAEALILNLINNLDATYYEIIGLLDEVKNSFREVYKKVLEND